MFFKIRVGSKRKKALAVLTVITILNQALFPTIAHALTAGPTAPEATSFEPIDTTDMVNALTGDFTYSLPLIEVPGPEGGYPLSLSYHAGIQPNEDASWVGLGWTLNPGAINRNVNGFADDNQASNYISRTYWDGGETKTLSIGVGFESTGLSFGLSFSQDTYAGFSVGGNISAGVSPYSMGIQFSGNTKLSVGIAGVNATLSNNGAYTIGVGGGRYSGLSIDLAGYNGESNVVFSFQSTGIQASMSTNGNGTFSALGIGSQKGIGNSKAGKISSEGFGFAIPIPIGPLFVSLGYSYNRYWIDQSESVGTYGVLYDNEITSAQLSDPNFLKTAAFDNYRLFDVKNSNMIEDEDPDRSTGGTFPDYDDYNVNAQGLWGNMRPYKFQAVLFTQNKINEENHQNDITNQFPYGNSNTKPNSKSQFRFIGDFANSYRQNPSFSEDYFLFDSAVSGNSDGNYGFNNNNNRLSGSRHIEYYTNAEILDGSALLRGFLESRSLGAANRVADVRGISLASKIGGFTITNASGVSYHFSLPAYSFNEFMYSEKTTDLETWNSLCKGNRYAYTWLLTAVTGPDYIDRTGDGLSDDDWGYWVEFNYGKWTNKYTWRNPSEGFTNDLDGNFRKYSSGQKDIFYLNAIRTRTHTALFVKELRADGKSVTSVQDGGFNIMDPPVSDEIPRERPCANCNGSRRPYMGGPLKPACMVPDNNRYPISTLKLKQILLLKNEELSSIGSVTSLSAASNIYNFNLSPLIMYGENVLDKFDIENNGALNSKALKVINFNYDYSLTPFTPNSFDEAGAIYTNQSLSSINLPRLGKLTLRSLDIRGKGGIKSIPSTDFSYDLDQDDTKNQSSIVILSNASDMKGNVHFFGFTNLHIGDIVKFKKNGTDHYCTILSNPNQQSCTVKYLTSQPSVSSSAYFAVKTKNPPYNKDGYDMWGCYKSDFVDYGNDNLSRMTTYISGLSVDAWSLRSIKSPIGADINVEYESDTYNRSVVNANSSMIISSFTKTSTPYIYDIIIQNSNVADFLSAGDFTDAILLRRLTKSIAPFEPPTYSAVSTIGNPNSLMIQSINGNQIRVKVSPDFAAKVETTASPYWEASVLTGNLRAFGATRMFGGGLRVKNISVNDFSGNPKRTSYNYNYLDFPDDDKNSSGVTSYEPLGFEKDNVSQYAEEVRIKYRKELYKDMSYLFSIARELPQPGVLYEYVSTKEEVLSNDDVWVPVSGTLVNQYVVYNKNMLDIKQHYFKNETLLKRKNLSIKNYTSRLGSLKRVISFDLKGNKLYEKINSYSFDDLQEKSFDYNVKDYGTYLSPFNYQGVIQERYADARISRKNNVSTNIMVMSGRDYYPSILLQTKEINYKDKTQTVQKNLGFDFYSGAVTKTEFYDSYGNRFINEIMPAYRIPAYAQMGIKTTSVLNKHMLTQEASNYTFKVNLSDNTKIGVVSASAQSWSNTLTVFNANDAVTSQGQTNIWRSKSKFQWLGGTTISGFVDYFSSGGSSNVKWQGLVENTKYNTFSAVLESKDVINNSYTISRLGYNDSKIVFVAGPSKYEEAIYSGVEDAKTDDLFLGKKLLKGAGTIVLNDSTRSHTGTSGLALSSGQSGFIYSVPMGQVGDYNYSVAVWVKPTDYNSSVKLYYKVNGGASVFPMIQLNKSAGEWYLLEMTIPKSAVINKNQGDLEVGLTNTGVSVVYADDFKFHPTSAITTAYVYDKQSGELNFILDNNNLYTRFQYDPSGRLIRTYRETIGINNIPLWQSFSYNFGRFAAPQWVNTSATSCEQKEGYNTGTQLIQQKDNNPLSLTYNLTRNIQGQTSASCPVTVYARLNGLNYTNDGITTGNFSIRLFINPAGTISHTLRSPLDINVRADQTANGSYLYTKTFMMKSGQSSLNIGTFTLYKENTRRFDPFIVPEKPILGSPTYSYVSNLISLAVGAGYTVITGPPVLED